MKLHGYDLDGLSRYRASFQQLHRKGSRKLGLGADCLVSFDKQAVNLLTARGEAVRLLTSTATP
jgi:hypothetical protein